MPQPPLALPTPEEGRVLRLLLFRTVLLWLEKKEKAGRGAFEPRAIVLISLYCF